MTVEYDDTKINQDLIGIPPTPDAASIPIGAMMVQ